MELNYWQSMASKEVNSSNAGMSDKSDKDTNDILLSRPERLKKDDRPDKSVYTNSRFEEIPSFDEAPSPQMKSYHSEDRHYNSSEKSYSSNYRSYSENDISDLNEHDSYSEGQSSYHDDDFDDMADSNDMFEDGLGNDYQEEDYLNDDSDNSSYDDYDNDDLSKDEFDDIPDINIPDSVFDMRSSATPPDIDYTDDDFLSVSEKPIQPKVKPDKEQENPQSLKFNVAYDQVPDAEPDDDKRLSIRKLKVNAGIKVKNEARPFSAKGLLLFIFVGIPICIPLFAVAIAVLLSLTVISFGLTVISAILTFLLSIGGIGALVLGVLYINSITPFSLLMFSAGAAAICFALLFMLLTILIAINVFPKLFAFIGSFVSKCIDKVR